MALLDLPIETLIMVGTFLDDKKDLLSLCLLCRSTYALFTEKLYWKLSCELSFPLHWAVKHRSLNIFRYLLHSHKTDINAEHMGLTPLMLATKLRYFDAVDMLLRQGSVNIEHRNPSGETVFWLAIYQGSVSIVERLLDLTLEHIGINTQDFIMKQAPITVALYNSQHYIFQRLLSDARTDVNVTDALGRSLLHLAVEAGDCSAIQILVRSKRVNVNCLNSLGESPLILAVKTPNCFRQNDCRLQVLESLLCPHLDINHKDPDGRTAISYAIELPEEEPAQMLLQQKNMDFSVVDKYGKTILAHAADNGSVEVMKLLLRQPEIHAKTQTANAEPLLWLACRTGRLHMVEYLLQQERIDINQRGPTGTSPLQVAINMDHLPLFHLLLDCGDKLAVNDYGPQAWTALTFASAGGKHEMVRHLVDHPGIDVNTTDDHGRTALWWAAAGGHWEVVDLLRKHPLVKKRWKDCTGKTAYAIAKDRGHGHVTVLLRAF